MTGRAVTRSAGRDQASSPATIMRQTGSQSQSSVRRTTRATRSQSRELSENDAPARRSGKPRADRQGSEDSVDSGSIKRSMRARKTAEAPHPAELSTVAEDEEADRESAAEVTEVHKNQQSPGAMSNMSGTTALTSHSMQEIAELDTAMIVNSIPDLYAYTIRLQNHLIPSGESLAARIESWKQLQVPGSKKARGLRYLEKLFESSKENYGSDLFINVSFILRKLFKDQRLDLGDHRPDAVFQAANVVILLKSFLVIQQDNPNTLPLLQRVDDLLPRPFFNSYESNPLLDSSALLHETFDLALALRTQVLIACLKNYKGEPNYNPNQLLVQLFYDPPNQRDSSLDSYQDSMANGRLRGLAGIDPNILPISPDIVASQERKVLQVINSILETFNHQPEAVADDDLVDFDVLAERFPWSLFLASMVKWGQLRMEEIKNNIMAQKNIDGIVSSLAAMVQDVDSQIELSYELLPSKSASKRASGSRGSLLPAAEIVPASSGKNFYNGPAAVQTLMGKSISSLAAPPSNQQQTRGFVDDNGPSASLRTPRNQALLSTEPATKTAKSSTVMDSRAVATDDDVARNSSNERPTAELVDDFLEAEAYKNKENNPLSQPANTKAQAKRFVDRQENAKRVQFSQSSQENDEPTNEGRQRKRSHEELFAPDEEAEEMEDEVSEDEVSEDEVSEDEGFQQDAREVDPRRRSAAVLAQGRISAKRARAESLDDEAMADEIVRRRERRQAEEELLQQMTANENEEIESEIGGSRDRDRTPPRPTPVEVNAAAKAIVALRRPPLAKAQKRIPWSEEETNKLVELIENHGCSWSNIMKLGRATFRDHRDQVALKDKARNIKVDYLKAGAMFPPNFDGIALSKKEVEKVMAAGRNPYRKVGEEAGEESIGLDGKPVDEE